VTFGAIKPGPGKVERRRRAAAATVRRTLDGPKTIVVINPKGGAHKTTATMLLAATFGLQRGGYTLAWDNNETRGTLGWRSSHADHTRTAVDLLDALPRLSEQGTVRIGDLDGFVRTQPTEQFDVLASDENSASASSVDAKSFSDLHQVLSRFYRVLVIDTGNNMRASNWQAAIDAADQIVVVSTIREDTAQSAAWALDALRSKGHEEAVRRAVTVLSAPEPKVDKDLQKRLRTHFGALTRAVIDVPHDKALVAGGPIDYEALDRSTRDAWLRVTAVVADGL
jgi:MinD-like ATPase involved in chromosome partitioning or flagellar assembly